MVQIVAYDLCNLTNWGNHFAVPGAFLELIEFIVFWLICIVCIMIKAEFVIHS